MSDTKFTIQCDENTAFKVEPQEGGLWSGGDEICIAHIFNNKRSRTYPSIPLDQIPELIGYLVQVYGDMKKNQSGQAGKPVA